MQFFQMQQDNVYVNWGLCASKPAIHNIEFCQNLRIISFSLKKYE